MAEWHIETVTVSGGFLAGLSIQFPPGLTCIIGPRGSGKSTLAEAIRYALLGSTGAPKSRFDLLQANLRGSLVTLNTAADNRGTAYIVRRSYQQPAAVTTTDGRPVTDVDVDRNTFLPLDAYGAAEIELIADESLGDKRRLLLDELIVSDLRSVQLKLNECRRQLESNADAIRACERTVADIKEKIEELGDARGRLAALPPPPAGAEAAVLLKASQQQQSNDREKQVFAQSAATLADWRRDIQTMLSNYSKRLATRHSVENSANQPISNRADEAIAALLTHCKAFLMQADDELASTESVLRSARESLTEAHAQQLANYEKLQTVNAAAGQAVRERSAREQEVATLTSLEKLRTDTQAQLAALYAQRESLKASYLLEREKISRLRSQIAKELQKHTGTKVRIRVLENADYLGYRQLLTDGLRGAGVRNHEDILTQLLCLRPEQLAQLIRENDVDDFATQSNLGKERSAKILAAYRQNIDPFALETVSIDDQIKIELNVCPQGEPHFKDASELSRGQKCTALLPLLLARRCTPLVIDQPEDNLDNHFIYETIVESIRRIKDNRQMLFITHNANIPVLGEAGLVVVMNSDGKRGYIEKTGTLDECRSEIIDLLEGGDEAFNFERSAMASSDVHNTAFESLRLLAVQDPRAARETFAELVRQGGPGFDYVLDRMAAPGEGRLRQLAANFARTSPDRKRLIKYLQSWLATETDQFARHAISIALDGTPPKAKRGRQKTGLVARDLVEMYRYVSERLRHELQNAILGPKTRLVKLLQTIARLDEGVTKAELQCLIAELQDEFRTLGRIAEVEPNDDYFAFRPVLLSEWLRRMNAEYATRYSRVDLQINGDEDARSCLILGSDYLLRLVFWNLWVNAHQAAGNPCSITLTCEVQKDTFLVIVSDNGRGFPPQMADVAFEYRYSQKGPNRGRGLLEVQDAIQQLGGNAQLIEVSPAAYRVQLTFSTKTT